MFTHALENYPVATLLVVGVVALLVVVGIAFALDAFIGYANSEPDARKPHPFSELNPGHCDRCWREANRRHFARIEAAASRATEELRASIRAEGRASFPAGRWPRI